MDVIQIIKEAQAKAEAEQLAAAQKKEAWKAASAEITEELGKALAVISALTNVQLSATHSRNIYIGDARTPPKVSMGSTFTLEEMSEAHRKYYADGKSFVGMYNEEDMSKPSGEKYTSRAIFALFVAREETPTPVTLKIGDGLDPHQRGKSLGIADQEVQCTTEEAVRTIVTELMSKNLLKLQA
jgi:hypothetical protein